MRERFLPLTEYIFKKLENYTPEKEEIFKTKFISNIIKEIKTGEFEAIYHYIDKNCSQKEVDENLIKNILKLDTEDFIEIMQFDSPERIDADGSRTFKFRESQYTILNTYGDEDLRRSPNRLYTPCIIHGRHIYVYDLIYRKNKLIEVNHGLFKIPNKLDVNFIKYKRAFYYYPRKELINIRYENERIDIFNNLLTS